MSENDADSEKIKRQWSLKLQEPSVSSDDPWKDDALDRREISETLTSLVTNEPDSLVISLSGDWGTGKTFFLRRWQEELKKKNINTIYFNAWEDDFCDDPLVAIVGQLSEAFGTKGYKNLKELAKPLFKQSFLATVKSATGVSLDKILDTLADSVLERYTTQRETKDKLRGLLSDLACEVKNETRYPLVFIVDELDRCRPTFAVELLERVKHIFNVENIIFVFGVNREELCSAVSSIYGNIKSDIYLRRFFDREFFLPETNRKIFCEFLIRRYKLKPLFEGISEEFNNKVHVIDFNYFTSFIPDLCRHFRLSLRDIDYCIRSIVFIGKKIKGSHYMFPLPACALVILRLMNERLYKKFMQDECSAGEVMDYFYEEGRFTLNEQSNYMDRLEVFLYMVRGVEYQYENDKQCTPMQQLGALGNESELLHPMKLSKKTLNSGKERAQILLKLKSSILRNISPTTIVTKQYISTLIELVGEQVKR